MKREGRRDPRYNVTVNASFGSEAVTGSAVRVTNVSARGCRFASVRRIEKGSAIVLAFGDAAVLEAKVRWRVGGSHGVRFEAPLNPVVLDHIRLFLSKEPALVAEREPLIA
jgi:hypothetical protein